MIEKTYCANISFRCLNEHHHCQQQSSVGGVRRLRVAVHGAFRQSRVEVANELLDVRQLLVEILEPKRKRELSFRMLTRKITLCAYADF